MTDGQLEADLRDAFSDAIMRGASLDDLEAAIEDVGGTVLETRQITTEPTEEEV